MKEFKYTTKFSTASLHVSKLDLDQQVSLASIENLKNLIPKDEVDLSQNIDLLGVAFNAALANRFNKNDDGIDTQTALKIANHFKHKPTNIEHKKEKIVGHILTAGFSRYGDSEILSAEELINYNEAFNISLGAVVYKFVNKDFAKALEDSYFNKDSEFYKKISASWELGFAEYKIAIGSRNLKEAEIISDLKHIEELKSKLKCYGGSGKLSDGTEIYRLVVGDVYPLGIGFTTTPAADVNGVIVDNEDEVEIFSFPKAKTYSFNKHFFTKKNSHSENRDVKSHKEPAMNLENLISEIKEALMEKKISQEAAANMTATFTEAIKKKDEEYRNELQSAKNSAEAAEKEKAELKASIEDVQKQLADALQKLTEFENDKKNSEALARFNSRMEELDQLFDLDDEDRQILADDVKSLGDSDEAFASYKNKLGAMWKNKSKKAKEEKEKEMKASIEAEVERRLAELKKSNQANGVDDVLDRTSASTSTIPNNNFKSSQPPQSFTERFKEAFKKENIIIS
jgi:hypothetical protein